MQQPLKKSSRKKFLLWSSAVLSSITVLKILPDSKKQKTERVKMITADGKLVEVDKSIFEKATTGKKASNKEIYDWMNNPSKEKS
jgi:hypothetical protein